MSSVQGPDLEGGETLAERIEMMRYQRSSTPDDERPRCPKCESISVDRRGDKFCSPEGRQSGEGVYWKCKHCKAVFDEPDGGESA